MYSVYVLRSLVSLRRYVGCTGRLPEERLEDHNRGGCKSTRRNKPYELIYTEECGDKREALKREKFLKSGHGRQFLDQILNK